MQAMFATRKERIPRSWVRAALLPVLVWMVLHGLISEAASLGSTNVTPWGKPLASGPIKSLVLCTRNAAIDAAELARRMDMRTDVVYVDQEGNWAQWDAGRSEASPVSIDERIDDGADTIILQGAAAFYLTTEQISALADRVRAGTGLLITQYGKLPQALEAILAQIEPLPESAPFQSGTGLETTPEQVGIEESSRYGQLGDGRVLLLDLGSPAPDTHFLLPPLHNPMLARREHADAYYGMIGKALRWVAQDEPEVHIVGVEAMAIPAPDESEVPPYLPEEYIQHLQASAMPGAYRPLTVHLDRPAPDRYGMRMRLRNDERGTLIEGSYGKTWQKGSMTYPIAVVAGAGDYAVDLWLEDAKGRVIDWYTGRLVLEGWPQVTDITADKNIVTADDTVTVGAVVRDPLFGQLPAALFAQAVDGYGRVVATADGTAPEGGGRVSVTLRLSHLLSSKLKLELYAYRPYRLDQHSRPLDQAAMNAIDVAVANPGSPKGRFEVAAAFDVSAEYNNRIEQRRLMAQGVGVLVTPMDETGGYHMSQLDTRPAFVIASYGPSFTLAGDVRVPCLQEATFCEAESARLQATAAKCWNPAAPLFVLGLSNCLSPANENLCQSADSLQAFREYLKQAYGELDTLNARWNTSFERWEDVMPATEEAAAFLRHYGPWLDFRLNMDTQFSRFHEEMAQAIRAVSPGCQVGMGTLAGQSPYLGYSWRKLAAALDFFIAPGDSVTIARLNAYGGKRVSALMRLRTAALSPEELGWTPWHAALQGYSGVYIEAPSQEAPSLFTPLGESAPALAPLYAAARDLNERFYPLLRWAKPAEAGVVVYDSQASRYLAHALANGPGTMQTTAEHAFAAVLDDLGIPHPVADEEALRNRAGEDLPKAILLPNALALSDSELALLRRFYEEGVLLLADELPGTYDEHGMPRQAPPLAVLFNQEETPAQEDPEPAREVTPLRAMLMPDVKAYAAVTTSEQDQKHICEKMAEALEAAGVLSPLGYKQLTKNGLAGQARFWRLGNAQIAVFLGDPQGHRHSVQLDFPGATGVYDAIQGTLLSRRGHARAHILPGEPAIVTALPYRVRELALIVPEEARVGELLEIQTVVIPHDDRETPADHVVWADVIGPDGERMAHYSQAVYCPRGNGRLQVPLAYNDFTGRYTVRVRDLLTGMTAEAYTTVLPGNE